MKNIALLCLCMVEQFELFPTLMLVFPFSFSKHNCDDDMRVDHSDVTTSAQKWPQKVGNLPNKAWKLPCSPGFSSLFILCVIVMWQCLRTNQIALFQECVVHSVFIFCLFFCKWGQKMWSARFWWVINKLEKLGGPLAIFMPYLSDFLPFMVIFERMLWRQSRPLAYHHHVICFLKFFNWS